MGRYKKIFSFQKKRWTRGYMLIEFVVFLVCVSIFGTVVLKGLNLIEQVSLKNFVSQVEAFRSAAHNFIEQYHSLPGNFSHAEDIWGKSSFVSNGSGDGILKESDNPLNHESETVQFWIHLACGGFTKKPCVQVCPGVLCHKTPMGGVFTISTRVKESSGIWLTAGEISEGKNNCLGGLLTPEQAQNLLFYFGEDIQKNNNVFSDTQIIITEGAGSAPGDCIKDNVFNVKNKKKSCIVHVLLL